MKRCSAADREFQRIMIRRGQVKADNPGSAQRSARGPHRDRSWLRRDGVVLYLHHSAQAAVHVRIGFGRVVMIVAVLVLVAVEFVEPYRGRPIRLVRP